MSHLRATNSQAIEHDIIQLCVLIIRSNKKKNDEKEKYGTNVKIRFHCAFFSFSFLLFYAFACFANSLNSQLQKTIHINVDDWVAS